MNNVDRWIVFIYTAKAQVGHHVLRFDSDVLEQNAGLLKLFMQGMSIVGISNVSKLWDTGPRSFHTSRTALAELRNLSATRLVKQFAFP